MGRPHHVERGRQAAPIEALVPHQEGSTGDAAQLVFDSALPLSEAETDELAGSILRGAADARHLVYFGHGYADQWSTERSGLVLANFDGGLQKVSDLRHFFGMADDAPAPARRLFVHFSAIVRAASARPVGSGGTSAVGCIRRPNRRPCDGFIMVFRRTNGEISWSCDSCRDEGVITGWEQAPTDGSGLDDSYADGDVVALLVDRELADVLAGVLLLDAACELLVARAEGRSDGVLLTGRTGAFEELLEYVAAESNSETNRRRRRQLDRAYEAVESALAEV